MEMALELSNEERLEEFEMNANKCLDCCDRTVDVTWTLKAILFKAKKEMRRAIEQDSIILKNTYVIKNRMLVEI